MDAVGPVICTYLHILSKKSKTHRSCVNHLLSFVEKTAVWNLLMYSSRLLRAMFGIATCPASEGGDTNPVVDKLAKS